MALIKMAERILIVDDDVDSLKLIGLTLRRQGYQISAANGGNQALERVFADPPDLIILDIMMPDLDGYEVARRLRAEPKTKHIPIIMFSAKTMVDDKVAGFEAGADDYLTKPTHPAELASRIKLLLSKSGKYSIDGQGSRNKIVSFIGVRGGIGLTTTVTNVTVAMHQETKGGNVVLAEISSAQGNLGLHLGHPDAKSLGALVGQKQDVLFTQLIEDELVLHKSGIQLLLSSPSYDSREEDLSPEIGESLIQNLSSLADYIVLDLGSGLSPLTMRLASLSAQLVVCLEPNPVSVELTRRLLAELEHFELDMSRVNVVQVSRIQADFQLSWQTVQKDLSTELTAIISAAPELSYKANEASMPMIIVEPDSVASGQFRTLAKDLIHLLEPVPQAVHEER